MRFLNGLLVIAVVAFMTACGGGAKTGNTEGTGTDSASTTETANTENTEKKNEETTSSETKAPAAILTAGKWMMDVDAMVAKMPEEEAKGITDEMKAAMTKGRFMFEEGGVMKMVNPAGKEEAGSWKLSEDGKTFTITEGEGEDKKETVNKVVELTAEKVVFEYEKGGKTQYMILKPATAESTEGTTETKEGEKKEGETKEGEKKEGEKKEETTEEKK
ncbi:MAG TPA: hypothetical protein DCS93_06045 [Microscillaceae bacterium]|nr:hypothetical protein [Microscillaceae bacterium]